jgi:hypothetical protein
MTAEEYKRLGISGALFPLATFAENISSIQKHGSVQTVILNTLMYA